MTLPAWLKSTLQVPAATKLTAPTGIEHTEDDEASMVMATVRPEDTVAVGVYVGPPTEALVGGVEVVVIVWAPLPTVTVCCF